MNTITKKEGRKFIIGVNIDKEGPLEKEDVEKAIKIFKEYYTNYTGKNLEV
jgi:hypothetical protein